MYKLHAAEVILTGTAQKMKFSIKNFFSKYDQMLQIWSHLNLRIWSHLLKKSVMENFIFCRGICCWGICCWSWISLCCKSNCSGFQDYSRDKCKLWIKFRFHINLLCISLHKICDRISIFAIPYFPV